MINVGDKVKVTNTGQCYCSYATWIKVNFPEYEVKFQPRHVEKGLIGIVAGKAMHEREDEGMLYLIQKDDGNVFIIGEEGIEKVEDKNGVQSGMIAVMSDGKERLILEFKGKLVLAGKNVWKPYADAFESYITKKVVELKEPVSNHDMCMFLDGKKYDSRTVWKEDTKKQELQKVVDKLQKELKDAQEKLNSL